MTTSTPMPELEIAWSPSPGALPTLRALVSATQLVLACRRVRDDGGHLVSLWGEERRDNDDGVYLCVVLETANQLLLLELAMKSNSATYPDLSAIFPGAARLQRAAFDMTGLRAIGGDDRPWLRHAAWPADHFPLRADAESPAVATDATPYRFVRVEGDGVHEIAVGPVHAGIIEPGHFRFSVVGEKVLRLEERLGYVHKGIEKRFQGMSLAEGVRLAARVSGDSAVAYAWAYSLAAEALTDTALPPRASSLRALLLERERIANHLGDLGALGNDAGLAFGMAQFSRLKEDLLRANALVWGARYPMDAIIPGGVHADLPADGLPRLLETMGELANEIQVLREIYDNHAGLQDRFMGAGSITTELAQTLGMVGLAARASGVARDWRSKFPVPPYDSLSLAPVTRPQGDVVARVAVRFDEVAESLRLCRELLVNLPDGPICERLGPVRDGELAIGAVEGWRGPVLIGLRATASGRILRCHPHDPSWHNWPALEHAIIGNIVPDFPLINKSFNLSYSGHDL
jgi:Ni,Fe-hydrogenase III large subunit/Ni,Fe-hydrogenase III component G